MFRKQKRDWYGKRLDENIKLLSGGVNGLPWIFCVFAEKHDDTKLAAARFLRGLLDTYSFYDIIDADRTMRQTTSVEWSIDWSGYNISDFLTTKMSTEERRAVIVFASFSPNGFIRERAVTLLRNYDGTLPYIILRLNDWVGQVREAAVSAFRHRMERLSDGELLSALSFAEKLKSSARTAHDAQLALFFDVLNKPENEQILLQGLESQDIRTRRMCAEIIVDEKTLNVKLADRLTKETDPFLRAIIFRKLIAASQNVDEYVTLFLADKYPKNRLLAFRYLVDNNANERYEIAEKLLLDKSAVVRSAAQRFVQEQLGDFDLRKFYLDRLGTYPVPALFGLGEKGSATDTAEIKKYLSAQTNGVVKAAMTALMRLDHRKYCAVITEFLDDERAGVAKTARDLIINSAPDHQRVKEIFVSSVFEHTKLKCLDILFSAPKWSRLIYMLQAASDKNAAVKERALAAIMRWLERFNYSFVAVTVTQRAEIDKLIAGLKNVLPQNILQNIMFVLG